jgi:hypothetical protein
MKILFDTKRMKDGEGENAIFVSCRKFLMEIAANVSLEFLKNSKRQSAVFTHRKVENDFNRIDLTMMNIEYILELEFYFKIISMKT